MSFYYGKKRNTGYYYRPYKKTKLVPYVSQSKKAWGNFKAAAQARDTMTMVLKCNHCFASGYLPANERGVAAINIFDVLQKNPNFQALAKMHDQVKIDGIRVRLTITDATTTLGTLNAVKTVTVYTAWDRTGVSIDKVDFMDGEGQLITKEYYDSAEPKQYANKIGKGIIENSSAKKSLLNNFQRWNSFLQIKPDGAEKSQYLNCSLFSPVMDTPSATTGIAEVLEEYAEGTVNDLLDSGNPCTPFESSDVRFKPTLLVGVFANAYNTETGSITQYGSCAPVLFNGEFSICCTFKNMKGNA